MAGIFMNGTNQVCNAQSKYINNTTANNASRTSNDYMQTSHIPSAISYSQHLMEPQDLIGLKSELEAIPLPIPSDGMMIPYNQSVSITGALTIHVPIETFSNAAGISPSISLSYNSQNQGISNTGYSGWSLNVGSSISRTRKNIYYDGEEKSIEHSVDDKLILDGARLIQADTQNISGCIIFEPVNNVNVKVKAFVLGNDFRYFDVYYPNGIIMRLGDSTSTDSKLIFPVRKVTL
jgi:hypothetical protein